jgi:hypothetical protein
VIVADDEQPSPVLPLGIPAADPTPHASTLPRKPKRAAQALPDGLFERFRSAYPRRKGSNWKTAAELFERTVKNGADPEAIIAGAAAYARQCVREGNTGDRAKYIKLVETWIRASGWEADFDDTPEQSTTPAELNGEQWRRTIDRFRRDGAWPATFGPKPGSPGCKAPAGILREFKIAGAA